MQDGAHESNRTPFRRPAYLNGGCICCRGWALACCCSEASEKRIGPVTTIRDANLRTVPRTDSEILALIPKGTMVEVGNCRDGWCQVSWNGHSGYTIGSNLGSPIWLQWSPAPWLGYYDRSWARPTKADSTEREEGPEHSLVVEIGPAGEWPLNGERPNLGGTIAAEIEPIENWLELEFGFTTLSTTGYTELSSDLLFKKPFPISPTAEFMAGLGPSFSRTLNGPDRGDSWSVEFALDWMFWPTKTLGWFIEPTWSINPRNGQQAAAVSSGILIGFPK
jgi:Bacterial SH3 domain